MCRRRVRCLDAPEPEGQQSGTVDPFIARSSIRLSEFQTLIARVDAIKDGVDAAREATEADFPLLDKLRTLRDSWPTWDQPSAAAATSPVAASLVGTAIATTPMPSAEALAAMYVATMDPAVLAAMERSLLSVRH